MINLIFTNQCPFCNFTLIEDIREFYYCENCKNNHSMTIKIRYQQNDTISYIDIFYEKKEYYISFYCDIIAYYDFKNRYGLRVCDYIPDFDTLQDLISTIDTLIIYQ